MSRNGFLVVGWDTDAMVEELEAGYIVDEGTFLRLTRWSLVKGIFPNLREVRLCISMIGVPLIRCDGEGIALLVKAFAVVEEGSLCFAPGGSLTTVEATVRMCSPADVPLAITLTVGGEALVVGVLLPGQEKLG